MNGISTRQTVLVIHPAWHHCGSNVVFERQIHAYRELGYRVVSLAVGTELGSSLADADFWRHYFDATRGNSADSRHHTAYRSDFVLKAHVRLRWTLHRARTCVSQRCASAELAPLPAALRAELSRNPPCLIQVNHYFCMPLAGRIGKRLGGSVPIVLDTQDIQSYQYRAAEYANMVTGRLDPLDAMLAEEQRHMEAAAAFVHLNHDEYAFWRDRMPGRDHRLVYPTVPRETAATQQDSDILVICSGNRPNQRSCRWFLDEVMTRTPVSGRKLAMVGPIDAFLERFGDAELVRKWSGSFKGAVESVAPWYAGARVVALPMTEGHGISIKTVEAFAYAKNFVGTAKAFRGIDPERLVHHGIQPVDDPDAFAERLAACLEDGQDDSAAGSALYRELFEPRAHLDALRDIVDAVTRAPGTAHSRGRG